MTCEQTARAAAPGQETRLAETADPTGSAASVGSAAPVADNPGAPEGPTPIRVVLVDDDSLITRSLATILEADGRVIVAAMGTRGTEAAPLYERHRPDIMLLDIRMPDRSGLDAARDILAVHPEARIVFLTTFADDDYLVRALRLGARGYLIKQEAATLARSLRSVMDGALVLGSEVSERVGALVGDGRGGAERRTDAERKGSGQASHFAGADGKRTDAFPTPLASETGAAHRIPAFAAAFTERERDIARLVADGLDNREIAQRLYLSEGTVRNHISVLLQKTGLKNRTQLAIAWWR